MDPQLIESVAAAIQAYMQQRPGCADTAEGIHAWWIDWQGRIENPLVTEHALQRLEQQGLVEKVAVGNRLLWRRPHCTE